MCIISDIYISNKQGGQKVVSSPWESNFVSSIPGAPFFSVAVPFFHSFFLSGTIPWVVSQPSTSTLFVGPDILRLHCCSTYLYINGMHLRTQSVIAALCCYTAVAAGSCAAACCCCSSSTAGWQKLLLWLVESDSSVFLFSSLNSIYIFMYPLAVLPHLRPRFSCCKMQEHNCGHAQSQDGRQPAAAKPHCTYMVIFKMLGNPGKIENRKYEHD